LIESIFCNLSGGCAIGSLAANTDIKDIVYRNIYSQNSNQMMMIKSNGGSGTLQNAQFVNFTGHTNAYTLNLNGFWSSMDVAPGAGVQYRNLSFTNWRGTCSNGGSRAPIQVLCPAQAPCYDIEIEDFDVWTQAGSSELFKCQNAYGEGGCLRTGTPAGTYTTTMTVRTMDAA
jgi:rhamnogalacturonan hydrolase